VYEATAPVTRIFTDYEIARENMNIPRVYLDTTILKASATALRRYVPKAKVYLGPDIPEAQVYDIGIVNPNKSLTGEMKAEAALLPTLADLGKQGAVRYCIQTETEFESWGLPKMMGNATGRFYGAPIEDAASPIEYSRAFIDGYKDPGEMQFRFISSLKHPRFHELQRMTGAYQGPGKLHRNQLLDAFHIWCAEHNGCDFFLTLDFALIRRVKSSRQHTVRLAKPSDLFWL
jgi:hypothetical protein